MTRYKKEGYRKTFMDEYGFKTLSPVFIKKMVFDSEKLLVSFYAIKKMA